MQQQKQYDAMIKRNVKNDEKCENVIPANGESSPQIIIYEAEI